MFFRHLLAMLVVVIGFVVGIVIGVHDWKHGLVVGAIIVGIGMVIAILNMMAAFSRHNRHTGRW